LLMALRCCQVVAPDHALACGARRCACYPC
jgi:hypothetical protein